ncbi:MAG: hypothetical protein M3Q81_00555, partial [bacterium]|nr:hypothetical protein [bacterium]
LKALHKQYPQHSFSWLIGSDQLPTLYKWGCDQETSCFPTILSEFDFHVYPRAGYPMKLPYAELKPLDQLQEMEMSSTTIRERSRSHQSLDGLVEPTVAKYIVDTKLYQE